MSNVATATAVAQEVVSQASTSAIPGTTFVVHINCNTYEGEVNQTHVEGDVHNVHGNVNNEAGNKGKDTTAESRGSLSPSVKQMLAELKEHWKKHPLSPTKASTFFGEASQDNGQLARVLQGIDELRSDFLDSRETLKTVELSVKKMARTAAARVAPHAEGRNLTGKFRAAAASTEGSPTSNQDHFLYSEEEYVDFGDPEKIQRKWDEMADYLNYGKEAVPDLLTQVKQLGCKFPKTLKTNLSDMNKSQPNMLVVARIIGSTIIQPTPKCNIFLLDSNVKDVHEHPLICEFYTSIMASCNFPVAYDVNVYFNPTKVEIQAGTQGEGEGDGDALLIFLKVIARRRLHL